MVTRTAAPRRRVENQSVIAVLGPYARCQAPTASSSENTPASPDREQLYFITEGEGQVAVDGVAVQVRQGDSVYVPRGHSVRLVNTSDSWLECLTLSAPDIRP